MSEEGYKIGYVAKLVGTTVHTLRHWERELGEHVAVTRTDGKQRRYNAEHIQFFRRVWEMRYLTGYTMNGVKKALKEKKFPTE